MKKNLIFAALILILGAGACNKKNKENTDTTKDSTSTTTNTETTETKKEETTETTTGDRTELLDVDIKCDLKEVAISELTIGGQKKDAAMLNKVYAVNQDMTQYVIFTNYDMDMEKFVPAAFFDNKTLKAGQVRVDVILTRFNNKEKQNKQIAIEQGTYNTRADEADVFRTEAQMFTPEKRFQLPGTATINGASKKGVCGNFEYKTPMLVFKGEFNTKNMIKPYQAN